VIDAAVLALFTAVTFGLAPVLIKMAYERGGTTGTGLILSLVALVAIYIVLLPFVPERWELLTLPATAAFIGGGLAGSAIGRRWSFVSVELLGASKSSAIRGMSPMLTAVLAVLVYGEVVTPVRWAAIVAIALGAVLVTWVPGGGRREWLGLGVLYAFGAAAGYGLRPIFIKYGLNIADTPLAAGLIGAVAALAYSVLREERAGIRITRFDASFWLFFASAVIGALGMASLIFAISEGEVSYVYPLSSSAPLFAVVFTALFLRGVEQLTWRVVAGSALIVAGVAFL
jgi:drug/metabolite transporter (DMT)-like permease